MANEPPVEAVPVPSPVPNPRAGRVFLDFVRMYPMHLLAYHHSTLFSLGRVELRAAETPLSRRLPPFSCMKRTAERGAAHRKPLLPFCISPLCHNAPRRWVWHASEERSRRQSVKPGPSSRPHIPVAYDDGCALWRSRAGQAEMAIMDLIRDCLSEEGLGSRRQVHFFIPLLRSNGKERRLHCPCTLSRYSLPRDYLGQDCPGGSVSKYLVGH